MTVLIIFLTAIVSVLCFYNRTLFDRLELKPYDVVHRSQWYRVLTHGFVHADWIHLLINMLVFWSFGDFVMRLFTSQHQAGASMDPNLKFVLLYFGGMVVASIYDLVKRRDNPYYASVGASGAVMAVVFCSIFYSPLSKIYIMGIIPMWAILFGVLYLGYEIYSSRRMGDNINHNAHIFGAVYGFVFPMLTSGFSEIKYFTGGLGL